MLDLGNSVIVVEHDEDTRRASDYIIDIRLGFAARLLVDSTMSVAEICYDCGFNNLSNFNRIFKKKKACSPKEFRENYRKKKKYNIRKRKDC